MSITPLNQQSSASLVGTKADNLWLLTTLGYQVPRGLTIPVSVFEKYKDLELEDFQDSKEYQTILGLLLELGLGDETTFAVRSSSPNEDGKDNSFAGIFESYLNIEIDQLGKYIKKVWDSTSSTKAQHYARQNGIIQDLQVAVIVQEMIDGDYSGIAFSANPANLVNEIIIESVKGRGDKLADGITNPDSYLVEKRQFQLIHHSQQSATNLEPAEVIRLARIITSLEKNFGYPVDVEWTTRNGQFYILQTRPITTLTSQDSAVEQIVGRQKSLTEWLSDLSHQATATFRHSDSRKRDRLDLLNQFGQMPIEQTWEFEAILAQELSDDLAEFYQEHQDKPVAFRVIPKNPSDQKFRIRGITLKQAINDWLPNHRLNLDRYTLQIGLHPTNNIYAITLVVQGESIIGEIIRGGHHQLTQGFYTSSQPINFSYIIPPGTLTLSLEDPEIRDTLSEIIKVISLDSNDQLIEQLIDRLNATVVRTDQKQFIEGYYEAQISELGLQIIDFN
ncbi:PEP/pyruvate-binding domain-containing protein, partial [Candidatus Saccharibacteria bacterium]|nr:PEP/pyruvate-binding domain-containing protein [Candidatus Saccharibacteria bacterium]